MDRRSEYSTGSMGPSGAIPQEAEGAPSLSRGFGETGRGFDF